jgi:hypothetical protein
MPVDIRGKKYTTVAERIVDLHENTSGDYSIETEVVTLTSETAVIKATLTIGANRYTGHAFENAASSQINKTSHLENCETSAIGRALAAAGYGGTEYASANEVQQAIHQQSAPSVDPIVAFTKAVRDLALSQESINSALKAYEVSTLEEIPADLRKKFYSELKG